MTAERLDLLLTRQGGKSSPADWARLVEALQTLSDGEYLVTIEPGSQKALRSLEQNRFQWHLFSLVAAETGQTREEIHDFACNKWLSYPLAVINPQTGELDERTVTKGTSRLSTAEHAKFLDDFIFWAQTWFGLELPTKP